MANQTNSTPATEQAGPVVRFLGWIVFGMTIAALAVITGVAASVLFYLLELGWSLGP